MQNNKQVYLDSAATTVLSPEVKRAMMEAMEVYGNPSSIHHEGRKAKIVVEKVRKQIAKAMNCLPGEIFFTSGGTEADNMAIQAAVRDLGVKRIITSPIEHHAVLHSAEFAEANKNVELVFLSVDEKGQINLNELEELLFVDVPTLVTLMHANNEIGNIIDLEKIAKLCKAHGAFMHSDTVQTVGHENLDLAKIPVDFIACAAHKIHGPKGAGFLFVRSGVKIQSLIKGGGQERGMRAGTENIVGIAGLGKAVEMAYKNLEEDKAYILELKSYAIHLIQKDFPQISFNGLSGYVKNSLFTILSLSIPKTDKTAMLLFSFDMKGISLSGGSACSSGASKVSHVSEAINKTEVQAENLRLSFSKYNTKEELDYFFECLGEVLGE